jgi:hypothetical protein
MGTSGASVVGSAMITWNRLAGRGVYWGKVSEHDRWIHVALHPPSWYRARAGGLV